MTMASVFFLALFKIYFPYDISTLRFIFLQEFLMSYPINKGECCICIKVHVQQLSLYFFEG